LIQCAHAELGGEECDVRDSGTKPAIPIGDFIVKFLIGNCGGRRKKKFLAIELHFSSRPVPSLLHGVHSPSTLHK